MRPDDPGAATADAAPYSAGGVLEVAFGIEIRDAGNVVGLQDAIGNGATSDRNRKHHGAGSEHAAAAFRPQLGLTDGRMPEAQEVADLVDGHRLEVETRRVTAHRRGPLEEGMKEDVGFDQFARVVVEIER